MSRTDVYVRSVMDHVPRALPQRRRIEADLRAHLAEVLEAGRSEAEAVRHMGPPGEVARSFLSEVSLEWASLGRRTLAFLVDLALGGALTALVAGAWFLVMAVAGALGVGPGMMGEIWSGMTPWHGPGEWGEAVTALVWSAVALTFTVASFLYFPVLEHLYGQTAGKWLVGIAVVKESGERVGFGSAVVRRLPLVFNFFWLDAAFAPFTEKKQRAFDIVASTVVVDVGGPPSASDAHASARSSTR